MDNTQPQTGARPWHVFKAGFLLFSEILWSLGDTDAGADLSQGLVPYLTGSVESPTHFNPPAPAAQVLGYQLMSAPALTTHPQVSKHTSQVEGGQTVVDTCLPWG